MTAEGMVRDLVEEVGRDSEGRRLLEEGVLAAFVIDGEPVVLHNRQVYRPQGASEFSIEIRTDSDTMRDLLDGRIEPTEAWFSGRLALKNAGAHRSEYVWAISLFRIYQGHYFWSDRKKDL